ncbi:MAG: CotH kinase family protein [Janthinobacterium lividum]
MKKLLTLAWLLLSSLLAAAQPANPVAFTSSNLPIVVINTLGGTIVDDPKITAYMGIVNNPAGARNYLANAYNDYHNKIGIELRGSSSQSFPQKSYSIESRDITNVEHDTTILGMPAENAWILYAPYDDKTCLRNVLSYRIANRTGHYASRTRYCELVLNGQYQGIYVLMEKIKRDANRVNIKKLETTDISGNKLTGGYIIKIDKPTGSGGTYGWVSQQRSATSNKLINFLYEYPSADDIVPQQKAYIKAYVDSAETALASATFTSPTTGYAKFIDVNSFIDYFILNEVSRNVDGYRLSTYLYKNRRSEGGKLVAGPVWDYNLGWWNANYCSGNLATGWAYNFNSVCGTDDHQVPFWWQRLLQDPAFTAALKCRWTDLRKTTLHLDTLNKFIDANVAQLTEARTRHFTAWPILGVYTWPNPTPIPATYPAEITALKNWMTQRLTWLDANMPGTCNRPLAAQAACAAASSQVFPNPFDAGLTFSTTLPASALVQAELRDITGQTVGRWSFGTLAAGPHELPLPTSTSLAAGIYFLRATVGEETINLKVAKR